MLPPKLTVGDKIGLVTISSPEPFQFPDNVSNGINALEKIGLKPELSKHALANDYKYLADKPELLSADFNEMISRDDIKGIIFTGGGTNANRLLPSINYDKIIANPKVIVGMSNPTVILNAITAKTNVTTFHGPTLVWNWGNNLPEASLNSFINTTMKNKKIGVLPQSDSWEFIREGSAKGTLYGGNLWSIQSLIGTPYEPEWKDAILFWEDIAKEPKRIDAMLTHFKLSGVFEKINGMVVGELVSCDSGEPSLSVQEILLELTEQYKFPVVTGVKFGHTDEKLTIPIGVEAIIDSSQKEILINQNCVE